MDSKELIRQLDARGYQARLVGIDRVSDLSDTIKRLNQQGCFDAEFYRKELTANLIFDHSSLMPEARSVIILAYPQSPTRVRFGAHVVVIPPTYIYRDIWQGSLRAVTEILQPSGFKATRARLPLKLLATSSGLGRYGRNNICYIPEIGSFHRLGAFYTDLPCPSDDWGEPQTMALCHSCRLCQQACPTGAIIDTRFMIDASRCLTYFNEHEDDFPNWVKPEWHNAAIGCMKCQENCPLNRGILNTIRDFPESFTEKETLAIAQKVPFQELPEETRRKLNELCLGDDYTVVARNIAYLCRDLDPS